MTLRAVLLVALGLSSAWCADPKVKVYIYPSSTTWGYTFKVYSDQTVIARIRSKKYYFTADLDAGRHFLYAGPDTKHGVTANLTIGRPYYLRCEDSSAAHAKVWLGRSTISCTLVDSDEGASDIEKLKLSPKVQQLAPASDPAEPVARPEVD